MSYNKLEDKKEEGKTFLPDLSYSSADGGSDAAESKRASKLAVSHDPKLPSINQSELEMLDQKVKSGDVSGDSPLYVMNLKLRDEVSKIMSQYVDLLTNLEFLQKQKAKENFEINKEREGNVNKIARLEFENERLKKLIEEQEKSNKMIVDSYERRLEKLKKELKFEREEKMSLLEDLNKCRHELQEVRHQSNSEHMSEFLVERTKLQVQIQRLKAEIEKYRQRYIKQALKLDDETGHRARIALATRRTTRHKRIKFVGNPKTFQEILSILDMFDSYPIKSCERLVALEELCLYIHNSEESMRKVQSFNGAVQAAKSLESTHPAIFQRALHLASYMARDSEKCTLQLLNNGAVPLIKNGLTSSDEDTRIEAMAALEAVSMCEETARPICENSGIARILTLVEEGIQIRSESGELITILALLTMFHIAQYDHGIQQIRLHGGIPMTIRTLCSQNPHIRRVASQLLCSICLNKESVEEIAEIGAISQILTLLKSPDLETSKNAATLLSCLTEDRTIKVDIRRENGIKPILQSLEKATNDTRAILLEIIGHLCTESDNISELCNLGIMTKLEQMMRMDKDDIKREAAHILALIVNGNVPSDFLYRQVNLDDLIESADPTKDLQTAEHAFKVFSYFANSNYTKQKIMVRMNEVIPDLITALKLSEGNKIDCVDILPELLHLDHYRDSLMKYNVFQILIDILRTALKADNEELLASCLIPVTIVLYYYRPTDVNDNFGRLIREDGASDALVDILKKVEMSEVNWGILNRAAYGIELLSQNSKNVTDFKILNMVTYLTKALSRAYSEQKEAFYSQGVKTLAYYSDDQRLFPQIVSAEMIKMLASLLDRNIDESVQQHAQVVLSHIAISPVAAHLFVDIPASEAFKPLIEAYSKENPLLSDTILKLCKDPVFKSQLKAYLPHAIQLLSDAESATDREAIQQFLEENELPITKEEVAVDDSNGFKGSAANSSDTESKLTGIDSANRTHTTFQTGKSGTLDDSNLTKQTDMYKFRAVDDTESIDADDAVSNADDKEAKKQLKRDAAAREKREDAENRENAKRERIELEKTGNASEVPTNFHEDKQVNLRRPNKKGTSTLSKEGTAEPADLITEHSQDTMAGTTRRSSAMSPVTGKRGSTGQSGVVSGQTGEASELTAGTETPMRTVTTLQTKGSLGTGNTPVGREKQEGSGNELGSQVGSVASRSATVTPTGGINRTATSIAPVTGEERKTNSESLGSKESKKASAEEKEKPKK